MARKINRFVRQSAGQAATPSIHAQSSRGSGTLRSFIPGLGLGVGTLNISATTKGDDLDNSPKREFRPDFIKAGCLPVMARSGNVSEQMEATGDDQEYTMVGDMTPAEIQAQEKSSFLGLALGAGGILTLLWMFHRGR